MCVKSALALACSCLLCCTSYGRVLCCFSNVLQSEDNKMDLGEYFYIANAMKDAGFEVTTEKG